MALTARAVAVRKAPHQRTGNGISCDSFDFFRVSNRLTLHNNKMQRINFLNFFKQILYAQSGTFISRTYNAMEFFRVIQL